MSGNMLRYAITDRSQYDGSETYRLESLLLQARQWAADGIDFIQIREKDLEAGELVALTRRIVAAVRDSGAATRVLVNSRLDVAMAAGADGVHLTSAQGELRAEQIRDLSPGAIVSISCHSVDDVARAAGCGIDVILFGPVFGKVLDGVQVVPGVGVEELRAACEAAHGVKVLALGGVTMKRAEECFEVGAGGVAGIRLFAQAPEDTADDLLAVAALENDKELRTSLADVRKELGLDR